MNKERRDTLAIIFALIFAMAPHTPGLPLWINLWCLFFWGYTILRLKTGWPLPSNLLRYGLTFLGILGLMATFRVSFGGDAFVGLLALMAAIKPFEMPTHRHRMITILLTYFIIITSLFRSDSLFILVYMVLSVFVTTTALVRINWPEQDLKIVAGLSLKIQALALPLGILLFLVFPRLPGSLVGLEDRATGKTGISDSLSPGSISGLIQDQTPAFRAEFETLIPSPDQLYWRAIVFSIFDGRTWKPMPQRDAPPEPGAPGRTVSHTILLPPHGNRRLPALDLPVQGPAWARLTRENCLVSLKPLGQKTTYKVLSALDSDRRSPLTQPQKIVIISPGKTNPRAVELAARLGQGAATPKAKASALFAYFRDQGFSYSLTPGRLSGPPVDAFLFDTRTGFCEHFASAFAFLMNAMDVPARVVGGYLGGEMNPYGNYLIVRQAYAHAWVEYWDQGWVRADPTLAVSPDRLHVHPDGSAARAGNTALSFFSRANLMLDAVNLKWETWFTGYSLAEQAAWLRTLGLAQAPAGKTLILITLLSLLGFMTFLALLFFRKKKTQDPVKAAYTLFLKKMADAGMVVRPGQGPQDFLALCLAHRPDLKKEIQSIVDLYVELRYKPRSRASARELSRQVKALKPGRQPKEIR